MRKVIRLKVQKQLRSLMEGIDVGGHGFSHFLAVTDHAVKALKHEKLTDDQKLQVELAALLHDADDKKIFPQIDSDESAFDYPNAQTILEDCMSDRKELISGIIQMIDLVSCSKNGDSEPPEPWMAIPRDSDRLEAIGQIGIDRCYEFTLHKKAPFHIDTTPRTKTIEDVWRAATPERFATYMKGVNSASMIDHYYDKLLHIGRPEKLRSQNPYILEEAARRNDIMASYVLKYWNEHF